MSTIFSPDALLIRAKERGWLSDRSAKIAHELLQNGLHPEQVLIGTGFLTVDQYAECLSDISGLPFARVDERPAVADPAIQSDLDAVHGFVLMVDAEKALVGFARGDDEALERIAFWFTQQGIEIEYCILLEADWQRFHSKEQLPAFLDLNREQVASPVRPAVRQRFLRRGHWFGHEMARSDYHVHDPHLSLTQRDVNDESISDWSVLLRHFLQKPVGTLLVIRPSAQMKKRLSFPFDQADETTFFDQQDPVWIEAQGEEEAVLQRCILDLPTIIFSSDRELVDLFEQRDLPARVIERHDTSRDQAYACFSL